MNLISSHIQLKKQKKKEKQKDNEKKMKVNGYKTHKINNYI